MQDVTEILAAAQHTLDAVRSRPNHNDHEKKLESYRVVGSLFRYGLQDPKNDERDEFDSHEKFVASWLDHLGAECSEPNPEWTHQQKGLCFKVLGDLNLLHSHDAGLNAAMRCYKEVFEFRDAVAPEVVVVSLARMLRAGMFASYTANWFCEQLEALRWAFDRLDDVSDKARLEFQISYVDMARRAACLPLLLEMRVHASQKQELVEIFEAGRATFLEMCDVELPYRRAFGRLAAGVFVSPRIGLADAEIAPLLERLGAEDRPHAQLLAVEFAEQGEDGLFYPHGGVMAPESYKDEATRVAAYLGLDVASQRGDGGAIRGIEQALIDHHPAFRSHFQVVQLAGTVAALLEELSSVEALEAHVAQMIERFRSACEEERFFSHLQFDDYFASRLEFAREHELSELITVLEEVRQSDPTLVEKRAKRDADIEVQTELLDALFGRKES